MPTTNPTPVSFERALHDAASTCFARSYLDDPFTPPSAFPDPVTGLYTDEALFIAVRAQDALTVLDMKKGNMDFNVLNENHLTPLLIAARSNSLGMVAILLLGGADPSIGDGYGCDPITAAMEYQNCDMLALLVAALDKRGIAGQHI